MRPPVAFLAILFLGGCIPRSTPSFAPYGAPVPSGRGAATPPAGGPRLLAIGLPELADNGLPDGYREIRASRGMSMLLGAENPIIRIVESPRGVAGELIMVRAVVEADGEAVRLAGWSARVVKPRRIIDWQALLAVLDTLGVATIEPPYYNTHFTEQADLNVELRRGAQYRAYYVNAPAHRTDPNGRRAARIVAVLDSVASRASP